MSYDKAGFARARALFPHTKKTIYFNSASFGPYSAPVADILTQHIRERAGVERDHTRLTFTTREELRTDFGSLINATPEQIGLGLNTSFGLNVAAFGLPLQPGDEVLVSDVEFPALIYTFKAAADTRGITVKFVGSKDRCLDIDALEHAIGPKTKALAVSWVQFFNGYKTDLAKLAEICRKHDMFFVVDGIQGMGVEPIDVTALGVDIFSSGCQKWMLSPQGCGFFYVADRVRDRLQLPFASWLGIDWGMNFSDLFKYDLQWQTGAQKFELGYYVELNILAMKASVEIFKELGVASIRQHNYELIDRLAKFITGNDYYTVTSVMENEHRSSIFTFTCDAAADLHRELLRSSVVCVQREGSIRISVHLFNDESDIDRLIEILDQFAAKH